MARSARVFAALMTVLASPACASLVGLEDYESGKRQAQAGATADPEPAGSSAAVGKPGGAAGDDAGSVRSSVNAGVPSADASGAGTEAAAPAISAVSPFDSTGSFAEPIDLAIAAWPATARV